jgi:hypothetical protein
MTDSMTWCRAHSGNCDQILLSVGRLLSESKILFLWGALSDGRTGLQFAVQSLNGPSLTEPITTLYCLIWDSPNLEGQVPIFISPRSRVAQLYPWALGSLYVTSYYSQGYGGGFLTGLHTEYYTDTDPLILITSWHGPYINYCFHYYSTIVAKETCLFTELLYSNGCCIISCFTVVAP